VIILKTQKRNKITPNCEGFLDYNPNNETSVESPAADKLEPENLPSTLWSYRKFLRENYKRGK
jgi:hypothetical protein